MLCPGFLGIRTPLFVLFPSTSAGENARRTEGYALEMPPRPDRGSLTFIGTATTLMRVGAFTWSRETLVRGEETLTVESLPAVHARGPLRALLPPVKGSVVHLGGTRVLLHAVTMDAAPGVDFLGRVRPTAIPVHYDDYGVFQSPLSALTRAAAGSGLPTVVRPVACGETTRLAEEGTVST